MIWGQTKAQRQAKKDAWEASVTQWHRRKIKFPRILDDTEEWVWLEEVWAKATWSPPSYEDSGHWHWQFRKELPLQMPENKNPEYPPRDPAPFCVFCRDKGSEYPVCYPCRKAVLAFRSLADAS